MLIGEIGFLIVLYASGSVIDDNICKAVCINVYTLGGRECFLWSSNKLYECHRYRSNMLSTSNETMSL